MNTKRMSDSADEVRRLLGGAAPVVALVLGSGWSGAAEAFITTKSLPYDRIPVLGRTQVSGHPGLLTLAEADGGQVLICQGRRHWYEGEGWEPVAFPVYLSAALGVRFMVLSNASGGIRSDLEPGDLMVVDDHINAMGVSPLVGQHDPVWGPRFPDQTAVYDPALRDLMDAAARRQGHELKHGVYLAVSGPTFETPAEVRAFRSIGADAVGMSTVPEAMLANAAGLRVAGLSFISNRAAGRGPSALSHADIVAAAAAVQPRMHVLLPELCRAMLRLPAGAPSR